VTAPDGSRWRVRRRWLAHPLPRLRRRRRAEGDREDAFDWSDPLALVDSGGDLLPAVGVAIVVAVALALVVLVVLPLLGLALELVVLLGLLGAGLFSRVVLRRPWIVEAVRLDDGGPSATYPVVGWRRSRRAIRELAEAIAATGVPAPPREGAPV